MPLDRSTGNFLTRNAPRHPMSVCLGAVHPCTSADSAPSPCEGVRARRKDTFMNRGIRASLPAIGLALAMALPAQTAQAAPQPVSPDVLAARAADAAAASG